MLNFFKNFRRDEDGAVTIDWVVLTAAIVGLGIAVASSLSGNVESLAADINTEVGTQTIDTTLGD